MKEQINAVVFYISTRDEIINGEIRGLIPDIWREIKKKLSKRYNIKETIIKDNDKAVRIIGSGSDYIELIKKGKYDILIGDFFITKKNKEKVHFTNPILTVSPILVYDGKDSDNSSIKYIKYLSSIWMIPLLQLATFSFIVGILIHIGKNKKEKSFFKSLYYSIAGFFGQSSGMLIDKNINNKQSIIISVFCFFFIYFFAIYINARTTAKSVSYFHKTNKLEYSISGERILTNNKEPTSNLVILNGGKIVPHKSFSHSEERIKYFIKNKDKLKLSGALFVSLNKVNKIANQYNLKVSNINLGSYKIGFPINKNKRQFLEHINNDIQELDDNTTINKICKIWSDNSKNVFC